MDTIICDGYGTLKTSYGVYKNALRIKRISKGETTYEWYIANGRVFTYAIFQITPSGTRVFKI